MASLEVEAFKRSDIAEAAALLAARQRRDRGRLPVLAEQFTGESACAVLLERLSGRRRLTGVASRRNGHMVGFVFGEEMLFGPADLATKYFEPRSVSIPWEGHACVQDDDPTDVYRAMYTALAADWARQGLYVHQVRITAGDHATQEAWVNLGFGRGTTCAARPTDLPVVAQGAPAVEVVPATSEEIEAVMGLDWELHEHHSRSPIFWPALRETRDATRAHTAAMLTEAANAYFVAYQAGVPIAMQTFERPGFIPALLEQNGNVYLHEGIVSESVRGGGVGSMLLQRSMEWARAEGHSYCTLHFASANPSGGPFWLGHGFVPVEYTMSRHLDERVAFANAW